MITYSLTTYSHGNTYSLRPTVGRHYVVDRLSIVHL
ncbi:hypothetical protein [Enterobacter phage 01_vB_Eclo_IJM]|nr:hypothetical protein [Enterobacter phage 01_vB_Eclo_IJM]UZT50237.1 hypothetical protein [Enterobacter phage 02_vB_Eclo_IJM]UZT50362.1 hypothetical protein [Enterobacter phage 03_vB_Eclo_IJM]UZT50364.1 hypothetical protein [Enterobacter phage 04_vB_Eclo_IJM]